MRKNTFKSSFLLVGLIAITSFAVLFGGPKPAEGQAVSSCPLKYTESCETKNTSYQECTSHYTGTAKDGYFRCYRKEGKCVATTLCSLYSKLEVKMDFNPQYVIDTEKGRLFTPEKSFTPFDDIICGAKVYTGLTPPDSLKGKLITYDKDGKEVIVTTDNLILVDKKEGEKQWKALGINEYAYQWKIKGWPSGWLFGSGSAWDVEEKINNILKNGKVICEVEFKDKDGNEIVRRKSEKIRSCVHLWGKKESIYKIATIGTKTLKDLIVPTEWFSKWLIQRAEDNYTQGFLSIDPFKRYKEMFSFSVDLEETDDYSWTVDDEGYLDKEGVASVLKALEKSECLGTLFNVYSRKGILDGSNCVGYTRKDLPFIMLTERAKYSTIIHEFAHTFCQLDDEYSVISNTGEIQNDPNYVEKNCLKFSSYKDPEKTFLPFGKPYPGCSDYLAVRTSKKSIMQTTKDGINKFNILSGAICLKELAKNNESLKDSIGKIYRNDFRNYMYFAEKEGFDFEFEKPIDPVDYNLNCFFDPHCPQKTGEEYLKSPLSMCVNNEWLMETLLIGNLNRNYDYTNIRCIAGGCNGYRDCAMTMRADSLGCFNCNNNICEPKQDGTACENFKTKKLGKCSNMGRKCEPSPDIECVEPSTSTCLPRSGYFVKECKNGKCIYVECLKASDCKSQPNYVVKECSSDNKCIYVECNWWVDCAITKGWHGDCIKTCDSNNKCVVKDDGAPCNNDTKVCVAGKCIAD